MRRLATLAAAIALLGAPAGAAALTLLPAADAEELAATLAEAEAVQGVCFSWYIEIEDSSGSGLSGIEAGSSRGGPGEWLTEDSGCEKYALLSGGIRYTSESSESEDSAGITVDSNLGEPVSTGGLSRLGLDADDLLGGNDDVALTNMVGALPLLVAETGAAPFIPYEANTQPLLAGEAPTGTPGSDWWRKFWPYVLVAAVLCLLAGCGIGWVAGGGLRNTPQPPPTPRARHARPRPRLP